MYEIGKDLLKPADGRKPFFSGYDPKGISYSFDCSACESKVETPIIILCDMQPNIPKEMLDMLKEHFGIGYVGKTRDGGWPAFQKITCPVCNHQYVVLTGVQEPANGYNVITVQGVCEIL